MSTCISDWKAGAFAPHNLCTAKHTLLSLMPDVVVYTHVLGRCATQAINSHTFLHDVCWLKHVECDVGTPADVCLILVQPYLYRYKYTGAVTASTLSPQCQPDTAGRFV